MNKFRNRRIWIRNVHSTQKKALTLAGRNKSTPWQGAVPNISDADVINPRHPAMPLLVLLTSEISSFTFRNQDPAIQRDWISKGNLIELEVMKLNPDTWIWSWDIDSTKLSSTPKINPQYSAMKTCYWSEWCFRVTFYQATTNGATWVCKEEKKGVLGPIVMYWSTNWVKNYEIIVTEDGHIPSIMKC